MRLYDVIFTPSIGRSGSPLTVILILAVLVIVVIAAVVLVRRKRKQEAARLDTPPSAKPKDGKDD